MSRLVAVGPGRPEAGPSVGVRVIGPSVVIQAAASPDAATSVEVGGWSGPLGLLLTLIETRKLDVMTVPLGSLAEAYLDALAAIDGDRLGHSSAFVAVAGQLILIKSRALLPRRPAGDAAPADADGDDPEADLRERLVLYRAYRDAGVRLADGALLTIGLFRREPSAAVAAGLAGAAPPAGPPFDPALLTAALAELVRVVVPPERPPETLARVVTMTERAAIIRAALRSAPQIVLQDLLARVRDRVVVAVTFLALLELMKRREIVVEQAEPFGPIIARAASAEERVAAGLSPEPDRQPLDESLATFG